MITDNDLYRYKNPVADVLMGFNSKFTYKNWDFGFNGRISLGNYNFNATAANAALGVNELFGNNALSNKPTSENWFPVTSTFVRLLYPERIIPQD